MIRPSVRVPGPGAGVWQGAGMSNGVSYPVFRTSDPAAALALARRLLALGEREYAQVSVDVELCTVAEVLRLRRALPDAWFRTENDAIWARVVDEDANLRTDWHASELSEEADDLAPLLPIGARVRRQGLARRGDPLQLRRRRDGPAGRRPHRVRRPPPEA
ncbi:hypothetical protein [Streptomyces sp. NBC_00105]|uniref:hypothetical protein n=1 Tax=Streptomyces sp. NBC_00105 TaxID=2903622 RepID=UPI003250D920